MAGKTAPAFGPERTAKLGKHAKDSLLALIFELVRPQRDQLR
jgi:hypothetical protein